MQMFAYFDFGGRLGLYNLSGGSYFSKIRVQRLLLRDERGEIVDDSAVSLADYRTPLRVTFIRHSTGSNSCLEGIL